MEAVGGVPAEGFVGDQVQVVELVEGLSQGLFVDAHGGSDSVFSIPADALGVGDETQEGVGRDVLWGEQGEPALFVQASVEPAVASWPRAAYSI